MHSFKESHCKLKHSIKLKCYIQYLLGKYIQMCVFIVRARVRVLVHMKAIRYIVVTEEMGESMLELFALPRRGTQDNLDPKLATVINDFELQEYGDSKPRGNIEPAIAETSIDGMLDPTKENANISLHTNNDKRAFSEYVTLIGTAKSKKLGEGFWGTTYLIGSDNENHWVVKVVKRNHPLSVFFDLVSKSERELEALKKFGYVDSNILIHTDCIYIFQPVLGDVSLEQLLKDTARLKELGLLQWLHFFFRIITQVRGCHQEGMFHNDLKPANIMLEIFEGCFSQINIIDVGEARPIGKCGWFGDLRYQSPSRGVMALFNSDYANEIIDLHALKAIFIKVIDAIYPLFNEKGDSNACEILFDCKAHFSRMTEISHRGYVETKLQELLVIIQGHVENYSREAYSTPRLCCTAV
jgi:hypothetical protein